MKKMQEINDKSNPPINLIFLDCLNQELSMVSHLAFVYACD